MDTLETLRAKNPDLPFYSVYDGAFRPFGRVVPFDAEDLIAACEKAAVMPDVGSEYMAAMPELEAAPFLETVRGVLRGEGACQVGCCWGYNRRLNCLEYHRASEHNVAVSDLVLLLAPQQAMDGLRLPQGQVRAFFVPKGTTVEVYATSMHYCPCQTSDAGFRCVVILPRGTNLPLKRPRPETGDGRLLFAVDKWLIAHEDNADDIKKGAYPGLCGENYEIRY